jgi:hypothetical protein
MIKKFKKHKLIGFLCVIWPAKYFMRKTFFFTKKMVKKISIKCIINFPNVHFKLGTLKKIQTYENIFLKQGSIEK